jgi:hypothetical protein
MAWAFDTLGYAKRLREAGVPNPQAEGHAEAAREFIMSELVTKQDLLGTKNELQADLGTLRTELRTEVGTLRTAIDTQTLRLTVRLGGIVVAGFGILAVAIGTMALFLRLH